MLTRVIGGVFAILLWGDLAFAQAQRVSLYNWPDYFPQSVIDTFEQQTSIKVDIFDYASDEEKDAVLYATQANSHDIFVTSQFRLPNYIASDWLAQVPKDKLPNLKHIDPKWLETENANYCVPYLWGTLGILYRKDRVKTPPTSWNDFFQPDETLKSSIGMIKDSRDVIGMALLSLGFTLNETRMYAFRQVERRLAEFDEYVADFQILELSEKSQIIQGNWAMSMAYNGDAQVLQSLNDQLKFVLPKEGTAIWMDCFAVNHEAAKKPIVWEFLNYIHQPKVAAKIADSLKFATTNKSAEQFLSASFKRNPVIYPSQAIMNRSTVYKSLPTNARLQLQRLYSNLMYRVQRNQQSKM